MPRWHVIRPTFWMTACAIATFVLLVGLGTWQLHRLEWKENLIAERAEKKVLPPLAISEVPDDDWRRLEHRRITVRGRFQHDKEILIVNQTHRGQVGFQLITPLAIEGGVSILVNRGWVPLRWPKGGLDNRRVAGTVKLTGVLRRGVRPNKWVPDNNPARDQWFFADVPQMAARVGLKKFRGYLIKAVSGFNRPGYPKGPHTNFKIRNKHLEYAFTWYGLAMTLVIVFVAYHLRRSKW